MTKFKTQEHIDAITQSYKNIFHSGDGKRVLEDLSKFCGYNSTSVCEQAPNELQTFFAEGKRRVYLRILWYLEREVKKNE